MSSHPPHIFIVLALYRPSSVLLQKQLESVFAQSHRGFTLLAIPDGSDETSEREIARVKDARVHFFGQTTRVGPASNFFRGLKQALAMSTERSDFFAYCDQDDIWRSDKLERLVALAIRESAGLCYSDASVIDENGEILADSLYAFERRRPNGSLVELAIANHQSGMTMLFSKDIARLTTRWQPPPGRPEILHDWWTALVAAAAGRTAFDPAPLVAYRRHSDNFIGPRNGSASGRQRGFLSEDYLSMCKREFALRTVMWGQLHRMAHEEKLKQPHVTIEQALSAYALTAAMRHGGRPVSRNAFRLLIGRRMMLAEARRQSSRTLEDIGFDLLAD